MASAFTHLVAADLDVVGFHFGIQYSDLLGHRGLSHSIVAAVVLGAALAWAAARESKWTPVERRKATLAFVLAALSHGVLDGLTDGGLGVAFLAPFDATRYFLPWRPIPVAPIGLASFFSLRGWEVLKGELVVVWLPCLLVVTTFAAWRRLRS